MGEKDGSMFGPRGCDPVYQGLELLIGEQTWILRCQKITFENGVDVKRPSERLPLQEKPEDVDHVIIAQIRSSVGDDIESILQSQMNLKSKGLILVHNSDHFPSQQPYSLGNDPKVPVVIVLLSSGASLLKDLRKKILVTFQSEFSADLHQNYPPTKWAVFRTKTGFYLRKKLKSLLGPKDTWPQPLHKNHGNFQALFQLIADFSKTVSEKKLSSSSVSKKIERVIEVLSSHVNEGFQSNFPFHIMMSWRLQSVSTPKAKEHFFNCARKLRDLNIKAIDVVKEVIRDDVRVAWRDTLGHSSTEILSQVFDFICQEKFRSFCPDLGSLEGLRIFFFAGSVLGLLHIHQKEKISPLQFWKRFIELAEAKQMTWTSEAIDSLHLSLQFAAAVPLSSMSFSVENFLRLVIRFQIFSFAVVRDLLCRLFNLPLVSFDMEKCQELCSYLCAHFLTDSRLSSSFLHSHYKELGDQVLLKEACDLMLFLYEKLHESAKDCDVRDLDGIARNEMRKWCECILYCLRTKTREWPSHVTSFLQRLPEQLRATLRQQVNVFLEMNAAEMPVAVFTSALKFFKFVEPKALVHFLDGCKFSQVDDLKKRPWQDLFKFVSGLKSQEWNLAKRSILSLLQRVAQPAYASRPDLFLILLSLSHPNGSPDILTLFGDSSISHEADNTLLAELSSFLRRYFKGHTLPLRKSLAGALTRLGQEKASMFCQSLFVVYLEAVIPRKEDVFKKKADSSVEDFVAVLESEMKSFYELERKASSPVISVKIVALWNIMAVILLGRVHDDVSWPSTSETSDERSLLTDDQTKHRNWHSDVRAWLVEQKSRFQKGEIYFSDAKLFEHKYDQIKTFYSCFSSAEVIPPKDDVKAMASSFVCMARELVELLYFQDRYTTKVVSFENTLEYWNVKIDPNVRDLREKDLLKINCDAKSYPERGSFNCTYAEACEVFKVVNSWLAPIRDLLPMLGCFTANNSVFFFSYLEREMRQIKNNPQMTRSSRSEDSDEEDEETHDSSAAHLETFTRALESAKASLKLLLNNDARHRNVSILGQERFRGVSVKAELEKLLHYEEFSNSFGGKLDEVRQGIADMIDVTDYSKLIRAMDEFCRRYKMVLVENDSQFLKLKSANDVDLKELTTRDCSVLRENLDKILLNTPHNRLRLFFAVLESDEFFQLIRNGSYFSTDGRVRFKEQVQLITNQLQNKEYNEAVLNHLLVAFECIAPFTDPQATFVNLLNKLKESEIFSYNNWANEICTVNSNMNLVKFWFVKSEGDTFANVITDLEAIMKNGLITFYLGEEELAFGAGAHFLELSYSVREVRTVRKISSEFGSELHSGAVYSSSVTSEPNWHEKFKTNHEELTAQLSIDQTEQDVTRKMSSEELEDFVRRLSFIESDEKSEHQEKIATFQEQFAFFQKIYEVLVVLFKLGHKGFQKTLQYEVTEPNLDKVLHNTEVMISDWRELLESFRTKYPQLLLFGVRAVFILAKSLGPTPVLRDLVQLSSKIFDAKRETILRLTRVIQAILERRSYILRETESSMDSVGAFLEKLRTGKRLCVPPMRRTAKKDTVAQFVHLAFGFSRKQLFELIVKLYDGFPESYELLRCTEETLKEDLDLFLQRARAFPSRLFTLVEVNKLRIELQEDVLRFQMDKSLKSKVNVCYILTDNAVFHEAPWLQVFRYREEPLALVAKQEMKTKTYFKDWVQEYNNLRDLTLVYGEAGNGKSHYIRKQLSEMFCEKQVCVIAVHEAFAPLHAIEKLQNLYRERQLQACIYFNFTTAPPKEAKDDISQAEFNRYESLMTEMFWFMFSLICMGFVEDTETGKSFRLCGDCAWHIYIEIPSSHKGSEVDLSSFLSRFPLFYYFGNPYEISSEAPFEIDSSVQLVCKYLKAYGNGSIDKLAKAKKLFLRKLRRAKSEEMKIIKFSLEEDLCDDECYQWLNRYMPEHAKQRKVSQVLFVKYMERRCWALDESYYFNYNQGLTQVKGSETDTKKLGSTLMSAMLDEVEAMCKTDMKSGEDNLELIIYDFEGKSASFDFLCLRPDKLNREKQDRLERIGIEVRSLAQISQREVLDQCLSKALSLKLRDNKRLSLIDEHKYVLTPDYAVKMLTLNERRRCGVPVIIEGETGVGKTALVQMLSRLWNQSVCESNVKVAGQIADILQDKVTEKGGMSQELSALVTVLSELRKMERNPEVVLNFEKSDVAAVCRKCPNVSDLLADHLKNFSVHILLDDDASDAKMTASFGKMIEELKRRSSYTADVFMAIFCGKIRSTFFKLSVHAALTPEDVRSFMKDKIALARQILSHHSLVEESLNAVPSVVIFFDEINTSSCMGLFKEILIDGTMEGDDLPPNLFIAAASNPHRSSSAVIRSNWEEEDWVLGNYYVRPLSPTLEFLRWDYGALEPHQENAYIEEILSIKRDSDSFSSVRDVLTDRISEAQNLIRAFAKEQLENNFSESEAAIRAKSCVSQRDIQRVFTFFDFFKKYPSFCPASFQDQDAEHALWVSLGIVYYLRLDAKYRERFSKRMNECSAGSMSPVFLSTFEKEIDFCVSHMHLPSGVAKTRALKENLFAIVVCTFCRVPLIIVGAPGSSKTLSFNLAAANLKGAESPSELFRSFPALDVHHYQCSRRSTSREIEKIFQRAITRQKNHEKSRLPVNCVVFMDEAGLPEESHESLKALHYYLDSPAVSFVAITNNVLDAAKSNRAVNLFRPKMDLDELQTLASGCLDDQSSLALTVNGFCNRYLKLMEKEEFKNFFGLRDFIHFIRYLRRHRNSVVGTEQRSMSQLVLRALERNFNGIPKSLFIDLAKSFLSALDRPKSLTELEMRNVAHILKDSLNDSMEANQTLGGEGGDAEVRYKLIIDASEDDSMTRLLFQHGVLEKGPTRVFSCNDFPGDNDLQKVHVISSIRHAALEGRTVILSQTDDINESFYDLFNQRFRRIADRYYANIAIGSHSKPCRVDPRFRCIVHVRQSELENTPPPFLNRFEKYLVSIEDWLDASVASLPPVLRKAVQLAREKVVTFEKTLGPKNLYGWTDQTVNSLFLEMLPKLGSPEAKERPPPFGKGSGEEMKAEVDYTSHDGSEPHQADAAVWQKKAPVVVDHLERFIREACKFSVSLSLRTEAASILSLTCSDTSSDIAATRKLLMDNPRLIFEWLTDCIQKSEDDSSAEERSAPISLPEAFSFSCLVQWMVRHVCVRLLQIATPEAIIFNSMTLPKVYVDHYLQHQHHFSLQNLVHSTDICNSSFKTVCYTRTTPLILRWSDDAASVEMSLDHSSSMLDCVVCKLEHVSSLDNLRFRIKAYLAGSSNLFLMVVNMDQCTRRQINIARTLIEENGEKIGKSFLLLLHFPASVGTLHYCYQSLFLHSWNYVYLERVSELDDEDIVDVEQWMKFAYSDKSDLEKFIDSFTNSLFSILPHAVHSSLSRVILGGGSGKGEDLIFNRPMSLLERTSLLETKIRQLPYFAKLLCEKFSGYWTKLMVCKYLKRSATSVKNGDSVLTVRQKLDSTVKTLLHSYFAYTLHQLNKGFVIELLFQRNVEPVVEDLLLNLLKLLPLPELTDIFARCYYNAQQPKERKPSKFPFFGDVCEAVDHKVDELLAEEQKRFSDFNFGESDHNEKMNRNKLKREVSERLHAFLCEEADVKDKDMVLPLTAFRALCTNEYLWKCYFLDFAQSRLNCEVDESDGSEGILSDWLECTVSKEKRISRCCANLHVSLKMKEKDIERTFAALRSLETVRRLRRHFADQPQEVILASSAVVSPEKPIELTHENSEERFYDYIISSLFDILEKICTEAKGTDSKLFSEWTSAYQIICSSLPSPKKAFCPSKEYLRRLQVVHCTYLLAKPLSIKTGYEAGCSMAKKLLREKGCTISVKTAINSGLQSIAEAASGESDVDLSCSLSLCKGLFVSDLCLFFMPFLGELALTCDKGESDWDVLLTVIDSQTQWISKDAKTEIEYGTLSFKTLQVLLTQALALKDDTMPEPRTGFGQVRTAIGSYLSSKVHLGGDGPFVPLCYEEHAVRSPLSSLYFHCTLSPFKKTWAKTNFSSIFESLRQMREDISRPGCTPSIKSVLQIEYQALVQVTILRFAQGFDNSDFIYGVLRRENEQTELRDVFEEHNSHKQSFLHHLLLTFKSTRKLSQLVKSFTKKIGNECSAFSWMNEIKESFCDSLTGSIFASPSKQDTFRDSLKQKLLLLADSNKTADHVRAIDAQCRSGVTENPDVKKPWLRRTVLICFFEALFERKVDCSDLAEEMAKRTILQFLEFEEKQLTLIACFADSSRRIQKRKAASPYSSETDSIWSLFDSEDASGVDLQYALAQLAATAAGLPNGASHLWTYVFCPENIDGSYLIGNMHQMPVAAKSDGVSLDCGCGFSAMDYQGSPNLHSRFLLLWMNFGAFALSLLTQPQAEEAIKEHIICDARQPVGQYCAKQVQHMWSHLAQSLHLLYEELAFFVSSCLEKFLELAIHSSSELSTALFSSRRDVQRYEKAFHEEVYLPVLKGFRKENVESLVWRRSHLLSATRKFSRVYPSDATMEDFLYCLEDVKAAHRSSGVEELAVLFRFFADKQRLRLGGLLLPQLIEFYKWLTEEVCHLVTIEQASSKPIENLVTELADSKYAKKRAQHIKELFENVRDQYNKYVKLVCGDDRGSREGVCRFYEITETSVLQSDRKGEGLDAFFSVIEDLVKNQNEFLDLSFDASRKGIVPNYLSSDPVTIQPLEVSLRNCLLGDMSPSELVKALSNGVCEVGADLLKIIQSNYLYAPGVGISEDVDAASSCSGHHTFDFRRIQLLVVEFFIFGKPKIANPVCIRSTACFKNKVEKFRSDSVFGQDSCTRMAFYKEQLPEEFLAQLSPDLLNDAEILFHDLSYENLNAVLKCLLTVAGDFYQGKIKESNEYEAKCREVKDFSLKKFWESSSERKERASDAAVASKIGLSRLSEEQIRWLLEEIRMFQLYAAFDFFYQKLESKDYEYAHLPLTVKVHLEHDDLKAIVEAIEVGQTEHPELLQRLKELDQALHNPEAVQHMSRNPQEMLRTYLKPIYDKDDFILALFSDSVRLEHCVEVRTCIRKVIAKLQKSVKKDDREPWIETVTAVWDSFPEIENYVPSEFVAASASLMITSSRGLSETLKSSTESISSNSKPREEDAEADLSDWAILSLSPAAEFVEPEAVTLTVMTTTSETEIHVTEEKETVCGREESKKPIDLSYMTVDDVASFVTEAGFAELASIFTEDGVTGSDLQDELEELCDRYDLSGLDRVRLLVKVKEKQGLEFGGSMTVNDVAEFIAEKGWPGYAENFRKENVDGRILQYLDEKALARLKIARKEKTEVLKVIRELTRAF